MRTAPRSLARLVGSSGRTWRGADFVEAENSMGFHADREVVRILSNSINFSHLGQAALRGDDVPDSPLDAAGSSAHR